MTSFIVLKFKSDLDDNDSPRFHDVLCTIAMYRIYDVGAFSCAISTDFIY
jgi:hypothetical protein